MAKMNKYFYVDTTKRAGFIIPENYTEMFSLCGECIREGFKDNTSVVTSPIVELLEGSVKTHSGTIYELQEIDKDYSEFLDAFKNNIPIIDNWSIEGTLRHGYTLSGEINGEYFSRDIISQDKNFVVLEKLGKCFVQWRNCSYEMEFELSLSKKTADLIYPDDFEKCAGFVCRPVLSK